MKLRYFDKFGILISIWLPIIIVLGLNTVNHTNSISLIPVWLLTIYWNAVLYHKNKVKKK